MVDSNVVLSGQTLAYTVYALSVLSLMGWFAYRVATEGGGNHIKPAVFYGFVGLLVVTGVSLHIITYNTIPWAPIDMNRSEIKADRVFNINIANHRFQLPSKRLTVYLNEKVLFNVSSQDLTYGFGLFRNDNSMLFQMQVVPGHRNDILWKFNKLGVYSIRSTEYSGPAGIHMIEKDAVEVVGHKNI